MRTNRLHLSSNPEQYSLLLQKMFKIPSVLAKREGQKQKKCEKQLHEVQNHPKNEKNEKNFFQKNENFTAKIIIQPSFRHPLEPSQAPWLSFFLVGCLEGARNTGGYGGGFRVWLRWVFPTHRSATLGRKMRLDFLFVMCFRIYMFLTPENGKHVERSKIILEALASMILCVAIMKLNFKHLVRIAEYRLGVALPVRVTTRTITCSNPHFTIVAGRGSAPSLGSSLHPGINPAACSPEN